MPSPAPHADHATAPRLLVIGSANMDLVVRAPHIPAPGETVMGGDFLVNPGGKGANQAVAAARLGAAVSFVASLGDDHYGDQALAGFAADGIDTGLCTRVPQTPTGVALITVAADGENAIVVAPGANARLSPPHLDAAAEAGLFRAAQAVLLQLETPLATVHHAVQLAVAAGVPVILNPAPAPPEALPAELLAAVSVLTPNQGEAAGLLRLPPDHGCSPEDLATGLLDLGVRRVVMTLGAAGALLAEPGHPPRRLAAPQVKAVDTTAAGDCFNGGLAVALAEGRELEDAVRFAMAAAALSVTRAGAQASLPHRAEVEGGAHRPG